MLWNGSIFNKLFGFFNETHCDKCDCVNTADEHLWMEAIEDIPDDSFHWNNIGNKIRSLCETVGHVPVPTFCGYSHQWKTQVDLEETEVFQYFNYPEYGLSKRILSGSGHWMLASTFNHRTSVCVVVHQDKIGWVQFLTYSSFLFYVVQYINVVIPFPFSPVSRVSSYYISITYCHLSYYI